MKVAVYNTKPYDRKFLTEAAGSDQISWTFYDFGLSEETEESAKDHDAICAFVNDQIDAGRLETLRSYGIKLIVLRSTGFNNVDLEKTHQLGISITRVPSYSPNAVAEFAVGLLLSLNRKIHQAHVRIQQMNFSLNGLIGFDIYQKTVGVIGTGKIGKIFAKIMKGFDANVIACDIEPDPVWAKQLGISYVSFNELLEKSDIISLHTPLLPSTFHLIDEKTIPKMKAGVFLINTSRGNVVKTSAVIGGLKEGRIGGFALDTYEKEAGVFFEDLSGKVLLDNELKELIHMPNVLMTAHQGFFTKEAMDQIAKVTVENLVRFKNHTPFIEGTQL